MSGYKLSAQSLSCNICQISVKTRSSGRIVKEVELNYPGLIININPDLTPKFLPSTSLAANQIVALKLRREYDRMAYYSQTVYYISCSYVPKLTCDTESQSSQEDKKGPMAFSFGRIPKPCRIRKESSGPKISLTRCGKCQLEVLKWIAYA